MQSDELLKRAMSYQYKAFPNITGLSNRTVNALCRNGFDLTKPDAKEIIRKQLESGEIWALRNVGVATVKELCNWCTSESEDETSHPQS